MAITPFDYFDRANTRDSPGLGFTVEQLVREMTSTTVKDAHDLPAPVAGEIELPDQSVIVLDGTLTLPDDTGLRLGKNTVIMAQSRRNGGIVGNSDGGLLLGVGDIEDLHCRDFSITQNGPGPILSMEDPSTQACRMDRLRIFCSGGGPIATITFDIFLMTNTIASGFSTGLIAGATAPTTLQVLTSLLIQGVGGSGNAVIDLGTAVLGSFRMRDGTYVTAAGGVALKGLASGANLTPSTGIADVYGCRHSGAGSALSGVSEQDIGFDFAKCVGIRNSSTVAIRRMTGNATATTYGGADTYTAIAGTSVLTVGAPRFTASGGHGFTFAGRHIARAELSVAVILTATASSQQIGLFKNGNPTPVLEVPLVTTGAGPRSMTFTYIDNDPATGDAFDLLIECVGGTTSVTVQFLSMQYSQISG